MLDANRDYLIYLQDWLKAETEDKRLMMHLQQLKKRITVKCIFQMLIITQACNNIWKYGCSLNGSETDGKDKE